jgi:hypothetical protein
MLRRSAGPKAELVLEEAERAQLIRWARRAKTAQYLALRAKIVLACAEGGTNRQAATDLGVDESTADRWRARFIALRSAFRYAVTRSAPARCADRSCPALSSAAAASSRIG